MIDEKHINNECVKQVKQSCKMDKPDVTCNSNTTASILYKKQENEDKVGCRDENSTVEHNEVIIKAGENNENVTDSDESKNSRAKNRKLKRCNNRNQNQRRMLANARERTRVHTLSRAFNALRRAIPCYSADQKLSKLSVLKIAISYISALEHLLYYDESPKARKLFAQGVEECTLHLQAEYGRAKRKQR